jgi:hypothetical protein
MDVLAARVQPAVEVKSGRIFTVLRGAGLVLAILGLAFWGGATAVNDTTGEAGGLVFWLASAGTWAFAFVASRNVKLFANENLVGMVGPFRGVRVCSRNELGEIRTVWHWWQGRGMGFWVFPTLHFRKRDTSDAFFTPVLLYRPEDLPAFGAYLGTPIDLERPTSEPA